MQASLALQPAALAAQKQPQTIVQCTVAFATDFSVFERPIHMEALHRLLQTQERESRAFLNSNHEEPVQ